MKNHRSYWLALTLCILAACSTQPPTDQTKDQNLEGADVNQEIQQVTLGLDDKTIDEVSPAATTLPDLTVSTSLLSSSVSYATESFSSTGCTAREGNFPAGSYRTLRFSVATINQGGQDLLVGNPKTQADPNADGNPIDGSFEWAACHGHYHFRHFAKYELLPVNADGSLGTSLRAKKLGFCMIDNYQTAQSGSRQFTSCDYQGISKYWGDLYTATLSGQFFLLNEPGSALQPGTYKLRITVNPTYTPVPNEICPVPVAGTTECRMFEESDYTNNVGEITLDMTAANLGQGTGTTPPPPPTTGDPCTNCTAIPGTLSGTRANVYNPGTQGFAAPSGTLKAWLTGPSGVDFDLYLEKQSGSKWQRVAQSIGTTASETISYNAAAGTYRWRVYSYSGSGAFTLWTGN
jgi:Lysyl oxidase/Bacterial pre-peptidase C-terminal domain